MPEFNELEFLSTLAEERIKGYPTQDMEFSLSGLGCIEH